LDLGFFGWAFSLSCVGVMKTEKFSFRLRKISRGYQIFFIRTPCITGTFDYLGVAALSTQGLRGNNLRVANYLNVLTPNSTSLGLSDQLDILNSLSSPQYQKALQAISPARNSISAFTAQNVMFMFSESLDSHFTKRKFQLIMNH